MKKGKNVLAGIALLLTVIMIGLAVFIAVRFQKELDLTEAVSGSDAQGSKAFSSSDQLSEEAISEVNADADSASQISGSADADSASQISGSADADSLSQISDDLLTVEENSESAIRSDPDTDVGSDPDSDSESETEPDTEWVLELAAIEDTPVIWAGDSRTVGMQKALGSHTEDVFIGASGEGYSWLSETGIPLVEDAIARYPGRPVIFNMGVNDYENLYNYMVLYADITARYPDTVFYFLSVNPVDDEAGLYITNTQIEDFNAQIADAYPDTYLDSYTYLIESDAGTIDGIHYSEEVYRMIYLFVKEAL